MLQIVEDDLIFRADVAAKFIHGENYRQGRHPHGHRRICRSGAYRSKSVQQSLRRFHIDVTFRALHSAFLPFIGSMFHLHEVFFRLYSPDIF